MVGYSVGYNAVIVTRRHRKVSASLKGHAEGNERGLRSDGDLWWSQELGSADSGSY